MTQYITSVMGVVLKKSIRPGSENLNVISGTNIYIDSNNKIQIDLSTSTEGELILPIIDLGTNVIADGYFYVDPWGNTKLKSNDTLGDFTYFADIFETTPNYVTPQYKVETFLDPIITYNQSANNYIEVLYRTSTDNTNWSNWNDGVNNQFLARYVQPKLYLKSLDGTTNVSISKIESLIDVPDLEQIMENISIPAETTRITFPRSFYNIANNPKPPAIWAMDSTGKQCIWGIANLDNTGFDLTLYDLTGTNVIAGKLIKMIARGL